MSKKLIFLLIIGLLGWLIITSLNTANERVKESQSEHNNNTVQNEKFVYEKENLTTEQKIKVVEEMIKSDKNGELWCSAMVSNYKVNRNDESWWNSMSESWKFSKDQVGYLVEKCEVAVSLGGDRSFLQELLSNLKTGIVK